MPEAVEPETDPVSAPQFSGAVQTSGPRSSSMWSRHPFPLPDALRQELGRRTTSEAQGQRQPRAPDGTGR